MITTHKIQTYRLYYYGKRPTDSFPIALIEFFGNKDHQIGSMAFHKEGESVADNSFSSESSYIHLRASETRMPGVVDMLRNEKPCWIRWESETEGYVFSGPNPAKAKPHEKEPLKTLTKKKTSKKSPTKKRSSKRKTAKKTR